MKMQKHVKNYLDAKNKTIDDVILCEKCGKVAVDIHHKKKRSQGGSDEIDNLIALCRVCHNREHGIWR